MGLFDFFKKDKKTTEPAKKASVNQDNNTVPSSDLFPFIRKYDEYICHFIHMQTQGNYAPISAYEKASGEIVGFLYVLGEDTSYSLSAEEVIQAMKEKFEEQLKKNEILSYTILYHSQYDGSNKNHSIANNNEELKAITIVYNFNNQQKGNLGLPYHFQQDQVKYASFSEFTSEENDHIFKTQLQEGKDYFQDRVNIIPPITENQYGIKVKTTNNLDINTTWCGIYGFESFRKPDGGQSLQTHFAISMMHDPIVSNEHLSITEINFPDIRFKAITQNENPITILPEVKTDYTLNFETKEIQEWENVNNLEAIVSGSARDTFGLWFFATDYAENRERYLSQKKNNVNISGIAFVLDIHKQEDSKQLKYSDDFTMYMPNKDLPNYGCFDFIGHLESYRETSLLEGTQLNGYILNVRLITNEEQKDFFTIDIFVNPENMRFSELKVGMKLTGMFQMQGKLAD